MAEAVPAVTRDENFCRVKPLTFSASMAFVALGTVLRLPSRMSLPRKASRSTRPESIAFRAIFVRETLRALRCRLMTALLLICADPTLRFGRRFTAYVVPPIATNSAIRATIIEADGR